MAIKIFFCYAREDELFLNKFKKYLSPLQRQGLVDVWYDRDISAGTEWEPEIIKHLNEAQIILLLISPDFMNSDYCYSIEMKQAIERHEHGEATVIPIILRPIYWEEAPFGKLHVLPTDGKPITQASWHTEDEAFFNVAEGVRKVVKDKLKKATLRDKAGSVTQLVVYHQFSLPFQILTDTIAHPIHTLPQRNVASLWRKILIVLGSVSGFALTAFGILGFIICVEAITSIPPTLSPTNAPISFIFSVICMYTGRFIFCKSATATIGQYIAGFSIMVAAILFIACPFQSDRAGILGNFVGGSIILLLTGFSWKACTRKW